MTTSQHRIRRETPWGGSSNMPTCRDPTSPLRPFHPHLVALVRAGARFEKGKLVERPDEYVTMAPDIRSLSGA